MTTPLNEAQNVKYQKILNAPHLKNHLLVRMENLAITQTQGMLNIVLPNVACDNLAFSVKNVEYTSENDYYWYGDIREEEEGLCLTGTIMLIAKNGQKYGQISLDDRTFEYQELGGNLQVLSEHNNELLASKGCGVDKHTPIATDPLVTARANCTGAFISTERAGTIRVLILYTPAAALFEPNINNRADLAIQQTNQFFRNSKILPENARLELAGVEPLNFVEDDISLDIKLLRNNITAQSYRNTYKADIVVLLTNKYYFDYYGMVAEIGPRNADAYAIVETYTSTTNQRVFAHEIGHLFGGRHDVDPDASSERGRIFGTGFLYLRRNWTIMANQALRRGRIENFSNPNVYYKNRATGTNTRNNAAKINQTGLTVAAFRPPVLNVLIPPSPFSIAVSAPVSATECTVGVGASANITCGTAPFDVIWENSLDGITWNAGSNFSTTSTFPSYRFVTPCLGVNTQYFVRATITDQQGDIRIDQAMIDIIAQNTGGLRTASVPRFITSVYPNPFAESTVVKVNLPQAETIQMELTNMYGTIRRVLPTQVLAIGEHQITIARAGLPEGLYSLRLTTSSGYVETKNIIVTL